MSRAARKPPSVELIHVADFMAEVIEQYCSALQKVEEIGQWEAPQEGIALGWLLIRNIEAIILMARSDEALVTAAWPNSRVAFELSARIVWMLQQDDRYEAEGRWLAFLLKWEQFEKKLARDAPDDANLHHRRSATIREFREAVTEALPAGYSTPVLPNFRDLLTALGTPEMYRFYQEGSEYVHGGLHASGSYSRNLGTLREFGDFTSTADWIPLLRLGWLSFREAAKIILIRLDVSASHIPDWIKISHDADVLFRALADMQQHQTHTHKQTSDGNSVEA